MKIEIVDGTWCAAIDEEARRKIERLLRHEVIWFVSGQYSKIRKARLASFVDSRSGFFLSGFLPRVLKRFPQAEVIGELPKFGHYFNDLDKRPLGITFRSDQLQAIKAVCDEQRGVIHFATASGKTVIAAGIINCFDDRNKVLFLAHSKEIVQQTYERFKQYGFRAGILTGEVKENLDCHVLCATHQTYIKDIREADIVIVDEAHHAQSVESNYGKILTSINARVRIGLTGTLPNSKEGKLALEGLIGPVIAKLTIQDGIDKKILSRPKITLLPIKKRGTFAQLKIYRRIREEAIVNNRSRNKLIAKAALRRAAKGKSVLIIVQEINHGSNLYSVMANQAVFLQGRTPGATRKMVKQKFIEKREKIVITTNIWNEGVDIPTLDCVVIAFGGKANTRTIQAIGRGLRRTKDKSRVEVIDFLDPYRFLAEHLVARLNIYKKEGLL